jgi:hypothetical protein
VQTADLRGILRVTGQPVVCNLSSQIKATQRPHREQWRPVQDEVYLLGYIFCYPHDNPVERIWAALKNYVANTTVSWPGRLQQIHSFSRARSPDQMLATAGYRRTLDQPLVASGLRTELLECRLGPG